jgi:HK97 family phage major capsid protein
MPNLKALNELRNDKIEAMETIVAKAKVDTRSLHMGEQVRIQELKNEIQDIDKRIESAEKENRGQMVPVKKGNESMENITKEERQFLDLVRTSESRDLTASANGSIIPESVAQRIIEKIKEISPVLAKATIFNAGGVLKIPIMDYTTQPVGYQGTEFDEAVSGAPAFTSVDLGHFVIGTQTKISKSLINNSSVNVLGLVVNAISKAVALYLEGQLINGIVGKMRGYMQGVTKAINLAVAGTLTIDSLLEVQLAVPTHYQSNSAWLMHPTTFLAVRKLQAGEGDMLVSGKAEKGFGYTLLGAPVHLSEAVPALDNVAGSKFLFYGDMSCMGVKFSEQVSVDILKEVYSSQHAVGVNAFVELDSAIIDAQGLAVLKNA